MIAGLRGKLNFMTAGEIRDHLQHGEQEINFIAFCDRHIAKLKKAGRTGTANNHRAMHNSLADYFHRDRVAVTEITANMLFAYEEYLQTERAMVRINQLGKEVKTLKAGMRKAGIYSHMRDLRTLFNAACLYYNYEDLGNIRIKNYTFKQYKVGSPPLTRKRNITGPVASYLKDAAAEMEKGTIEKMNPAHFLMKLFSLLSYPLITAPLYQTLFQLSATDFQLLINERSKLIVGLLFKKI